MPLIMHFIKAPRFYDSYLEEYISLPTTDLNKIDRYYFWMEKVKTGQTRCSFKEWSGLSKEDLPHEEVVKYYKDFYVQKPIIFDGDCEEAQVQTIFTDLARVVKMNQLVNWAMKHVTNGEVELNCWYEISKEQLKDLCARLKRTRRCLSFVGEELIVKDKWLANELLPLMKEVPLFWGTDEYDSVYARQVADAYEIIQNVLNATDFEKESIYLVRVN